MNATSRSGNEVDRALASVKRSMAQLINLLKSPDEAVRAGAADAATPPSSNASTHSDRDMTGPRC